MQGLIRAPLPILAGQVIVQTLEVRESGELFSSLSLLSIVVFVGTLGLDRVFYHELGRARVSGELAMARGMRRAVPILMLITCGVCLALLIPAHFFVKQDDMKTLMHFAMILALLPFFCLAKYLYAALMTFGRPVLATMLSNTIPLVIVIIVMGIMMFAGMDDMFVWQAVVVYFFAYGLSVLAMFFIRRTCEPPEFRIGNREYHLGKWIAQGSAQSISILTMVIMCQAAILYCGW
ncbi:MAG: hypothetical protein MK085_05835, partial [Phycisphaerales bacterium]|nr:hypothetical protein [Phycisphaerales bacterium]